MSMGVKKNIDLAIGLWGPITWEELVVASSPLKVFAFVGSWRGHLSWNYSLKMGGCY